MLPAPAGTTTRPCVSARTRTCAASSAHCSSSWRTQGRRTHTWGSVSLSWPLSRWEWQPVGPGHVGCAQSPADCPTPGTLLHCTPLQSPAMPLSRCSSVTLGGNCALPSCITGCQACASADRGQGALRLCTESRTRGNGMLPPRAHQQRLNSGACTVSVLPYRPGLQ